MLTAICFLLGVILTDSARSYEQAATDYFFETVWLQKYEKYKSVEFDNRTDTTRYIRNIYGCRKWDEETKKAFEKGKKIKEQVQVKAVGTNVSIKKRSKTKRLKLFIGTKVQIGDGYIVEIKVYKPFEFVDHYFIKFGGDGKVVDTEFSEII